MEIDEQKTESTSKPLFLLLLSLKFNTNRSFCRRSCIHDDGIRFCIYKGNIIGPNEAIA